MNILKIIITFILASTITFSMSAKDDGEKVINDFTRYYSEDVCEIQIERPGAKKFLGTTTSYREIEFRLNAIAVSGVGVVFDLQVNMHDGEKGLAAIWGTKSVEMPKDPRFLLKTFDGEVLQFVSVSSNESTIFLDEGTKTTITQIGDTFHSQTINLLSIYGETQEHFYITEAQLEKLFKGIAKFRIEALDHNVEKTFKKDKIGKELRKAYIKIVSKIQSRANKRETFTDDF